MCYHFKDDDTQEYIDQTVNRLKLKSWIHREVRYYINGFSHGKVAALKQGADCIDELSWGLIPFWARSEQEAKERARGNLNAKCETIFQLPSFKHCIKKQKCLIFASGFYEWRHLDAKEKIPYVIGVKDKDDPNKFSAFTMGGIFDRWTNKDTGEVFETCSIITTPANKMMDIVHNAKQRMPLIIADEDQEVWLSTEDPETIKSLMKPFPAEKMKAYSISKHISQTKVDRNVPEVYAPYTYAGVEDIEFA